MRIWGIKNGLVSILVGFLSLVIAIFLAFILQGTVSEFLYNNTPIGTSIQKVATNFVTENLKNEDSSSKDKNTIEFINKIVNKGEDEDKIINDAAITITKYILSGISFIGIIIVVLIICYILTMLLNFVFDFPILSSINKFGGIGINLLKTLLKLWILLAIISFVSTLPILDPVIEQINQSFVVKVLYENNLLVNIVKSTIKL